MSAARHAREGRTRLLLGNAQFFPCPGGRDSWPRKEHAAMARLMATLEMRIAKRAKVSRVSGGYIVQYEGIDAALSPRQRLSWTWRYLVTRLKMLIWEPPQPRGGVVSGLTGIAVFLAGRKRTALRDEWRAHLAGESGHDTADWRKAREALGFVASAIRCRCSDAAQAAWTPADAVLKSRTRSNLFVLAPTWAAAYLVLRHEGTLGVVKAAESISAIGGALYGLVRVGRWWRDVKPPEPKAQRAKE